MKPILLVEHTGDEGPYVSVKLLLVEVLITLYRYVVIHENAQISQAVEISLFTHRIIMF